MSQSPLIGAFVPGLRLFSDLECEFPVSIPSDRGIRSGLLTRAKGIWFIQVSIPSDRGIRSGIQDQRFLVYRELPSQSPLIGAFVPGEIHVAVLNATYMVSIPSDRGIRSG